ncbi:MAG: M23 family metallopeptidase [Promethearchaeota archaeon]
MDSMKRSTGTWLAVVLAVSCVLALVSCWHAYDASHLARKFRPASGWPLADGEDPVLSPVVPLDAGGDNQNISWVQPFGWVTAGRFHEGWDFVVAGGAEYTSFVAPARCVVTSVRLWRDEGTGYWCVEVRAHLNEEWSVYFNFEPFSADEGVGQEQLGLVEVAVGDVVEAGSLVGVLRSAGPSAHVHFSLERHLERVCPLAYCDEAAREFVEAKVQAGLEPCQE